jgi:hypothetical protein
MLYGLLHDNCSVSVGQSGWLQDSPQLHYHSRHEVSVKCEETVVDSSTTVNSYNSYCCSAVVGE